MLKKICLFFFLGFTFVLQAEDKYSFEVKCERKNGTDRLILHGDFIKGQPADGCYFFSQYETRIDGKLQPGGFSFLDPEVFDVALGWKRLKEDWAGNNFPADDISGLTNGMVINKALSFSVLPVFKNGTDSVTLFFKYAVYNLTDGKPSEEFDNNFNIKLYYKMLKVPLNESFSPSFINIIYDSCSFEFIIKNERNVIQSLFIQEPDEFFSAVKQSVEESKIAGNVDIKFVSEFLQADSLKQEGLMWQEFRQRAKQSSLARVKFLRDERTNEKAEFPIPVYSARFTFPFLIHNKEKEKLYDSYKRNYDIFQSEYNLVIVPISFSNDSLTADVFLDYSKIIVDNFPRWTPIKKRIKIKLNEGIMLDMPKENWTANFTRSDKKYDIYGYSDFERFVNEYLAIQFESIKVNPEF